MLDLRLTRRSLSPWSDSPFFVLYSRCDICVIVGMFESIVFWSSSRRKNNPSWEGFGTRCSKWQPLCASSLGHRLCVKLAPQGKIPSLQRQAVGRGQACQAWPRNPLENEKPFMHG